MSVHPNLDRRDFLKLAGAGALATVLPPVPVHAQLIGKSIRKGRILKPDQKLRVAGVGCGGKGMSDIMNVADEQIVALCDVDFARGTEVFKKFPDVPKYKDFRQMLLEMDDKIDAVTVSTPDHMHFPVALMAIEMGKHVYVQKPLTHTVWEARALAEAARRHEVVSQMGNQGHAGEGTRLIHEWVRSGAIGPVREVHIWTNRPIWPQGCQRPPGETPPPSSLDWNRWLGVAPARPYDPGYCPFNWRGWWDFGCGALGDMGCHIMDAAYWALDLGAPTSFEAESDGMTDESAPKSSLVTYQFPARGSMPPVTLKWYDGGRMPARPAGLEPEREMPKGGQIIVGEKYTILDTTDYAQSPRIIPEAKMKEFMTNKPEKWLPRVPGGDPHKEWVNGCKEGGVKPGSNIPEYSGPFTEMVVLGNLAVRLGKKVAWDAKNLRCPGVPEADALIRKQYRVF